MPAKRAPISDVLDDLAHASDGKSVSAGQVIDSFQHRSLGVMMTVLGLITSMPVIGGIPGVSVVTGTLILIAIGQSLAGGGALWMPEFVRKQEFQRDKFNQAIQKTRPWIRRVDCLVRSRLTFLACGPISHWVICVAAAFLALTFYPLELIPWGVTVPALGVLAFGLGLMARDGLFVLLGYAFSAGTGYLLYATLLS